VNRATSNLEYAQSTAQKENTRMPYTQIETAQSLMATLQGVQTVVAALASGRIPAPTIAPRQIKINDTRFAPHYAPGVGRKDKGTVAYNALDVARVLGCTEQKKDALIANRWVRCALAVLGCWELHLIDQDFLDNIAVGAAGYNCKSITKECQARLRTKYKMTHSAKYQRERRLVASIFAKPKRVPFTPVPRPEPVAQ
jgi:hypothetical protein